MPVSQLQHINIRCSNVEASRLFYEAVGLRTGARPPFASHGYWLYLGVEPVVHLVQRPAGEPARDTGTGNLDHVAFEGRDLEGTRQVLQALGLVFRETVVPRDGVTQIFVSDPDGVMLEMNFAP